MTNSEKNHEQQTALLVSQGNPAAMKELYCATAEYLTAVCARYISDDEDVKDILQDSYVKIFTSAGKFEYRGEGSLRAWMTRIVVNESLKFLKRTEKAESCNTATVFPTWPTTASPTWPAFLPHACTK